MVIPEKIYTDNPFVDNVIYYAKYMAMNCTVKDEDEALANETKESLENGDILISCIEQTSVYEIFKSIPMEILEKYITSTSNLDIYADDPNALKTHLNHYGIYERTDLLNKISKIARDVYMDHYEIMTNYIDKIGPSWADDNKALYDSCVNSTATYKDLFDITPTHTTIRILKQYLNNYDSTDLESISGSLSDFENYVSSRTDPQIIKELENISDAMRKVFASHYEIMIQRKYVKESYDTWYPYIDIIDTYNNCKNDKATYHELYDLMPKNELLDSLNTCLGESIVSEYNLAENLDILENYLSKISSTPEEDKHKLSKNMQAKYLANYNSYLNYSIYAACTVDTLDYFDLVDYLPRETKKMILNTQIAEVTNLQVYQENKQMLNGYLQTIPEPRRSEIKNSINKDMRIWYPLNHIEKNNYYRSLIGLPPMDSNGNVYEDTLVHSWDPTTKSFKEFGDRFTKDLPTELYPAIHWTQNIYEFDAYDVGLLTEYGILDEYVAACEYSISDPRYRYLRYLGDNKLDLYQCRKALKFQLIGIPTVDDVDAQKRFVDLYAINRDYCIRSVYSDAHKFQSDYYDKFMIIFIIINTIMDLLTDITTMIIDREVFDSRCIKWLFESFGVPYYSEIPEKYLRAMLKNLNNLLKYKSSTKNMIDICNLFGFSDVRVFNYYLFRERSFNTTTGEYEFGEDNDISYDLNELWIRDTNGETQDYNGIRYTKLLQYRHYNEDKYTKEVHYEENGEVKTKRIIKNDAEVYLKDPDSNDFIPLKDTIYFSQIKAETSPAELKFIKVPMGEELTSYKNDPDHIISYDEVVYADEGDTWDGGRVHKDLYKELVDHEFNAVRTKYISVETITDLTEQSFQVSYFYNMLFDNLYSEEALTLKIPYLELGHDFRFMDIVCYLFALMYFYNDLKDNIMYSPTQILYVKGYNFNEAINDLMDDPEIYTQEPRLSDRTNIFDVNEQIANNGYDYREEFEYNTIKGFNLEADIDELEKWLNDYCQMSLDDFIVDDSCTDFSQVITLRQFFSLNNSYYQKDIFKDAIAALPYNQDIKSAYDVLLYKKTVEKDIDKYEHEYVTENGYKMEVINIKENEIFITDSIKYIFMPNKQSHTIIAKYIKQDDGNYTMFNNQYYYYDNTRKVIDRLFNDDIYVINNNGDYVFASDAFYTKNSEGEYIEITDDRYFIQDKYEPDKRCLLFGEYWILNENGKWELDEEQAYVWVEVNGVGSYVKVKDANMHIDFDISEDNYWVKHSDGHFIKYTETDFYRTHQSESGTDNKDGENTIYEFIDEFCYIEVGYPTSETDVDIDGIRRYFKKLSDFYYENNWVYRDDVYVCDPNTGEYIPGNELISPNNCYYCASKSQNIYRLVVDNYAEYKEYDHPDIVNYILVLQENNDYSKLQKDGNDYIISNDPIKRYVYNSDTDYITVLITDATYKQTNSMIVVFNKEITSSNTSELISPEKYNPEETDDIWDENDWFYEDESYSSEDIGMHGENMWYYRKPDAEITIKEDDTIKAEPVGSGFYMESTAYIGNVKLEKGNKYYMAFDVETNFTGRIQIYNTADDSVNGSTDKIYEITKREKKHVAQLFTANNVSTPDIRLLIYNFDQFPIEPGDYIVISNIRFICAYSDNFVTRDIQSYEKLQEIYRTNDAIYKYLVSLMIEETDYYKYNIYKKIYDSLMISKYNKEAFKIGENTYARTYTEFLENRDSVLYSKLVRFMSLDKDTMHKEVADEIIEITYAIDDCVDTYSYGFLYSYFPAVSANYIQQYITKLINWFKSWKVHMLGIDTIYKINDPMDNNLKILEDEDYKTRFDHFKCNAYIHDTVQIDPVESVNISGVKYADIYDFDEPTNQCNDKTKIHDRVRLICHTEDGVSYQDSATQLHLTFKNDQITANVDDENKLKITSGVAGFETTNDNEIIMSLDENEQQLFANQFIADINTFSSDYIEWSDLDE